MFKRTRAAFYFVLCVIPALVLICVASYLYCKAVSRTS
jgi:hypothetical protein